MFDLSIGDPILSPAQAAAWGLRVANSIDIIVFGKAVSGSSRYNQSLTSYSRSNRCWPLQLLPGQFILFIYVTLIIHIFAIAALRPDLREHKQLSEPDRHHRLSLASHHLWAFNRRFNLPAQRQSTGHH